VGFRHEAKILHGMKAKRIRKLEKSYGLDMLLKEWSRAHISAAPLPPIFILHNTTTGYDYKLLCFINPWLKGVSHEN
jgi:hypothetical protein